MINLCKQPICSHIVLLGFVLLLVGCGGSSIQNPVQEPEEDTDNLTQVDANHQSLNVAVEVSKSTVQTGEAVNLKATVDGIRGTNLILNWVNVTGYGELSVVNQHSALWTAPKSLDSLEVKVEVIQLIATGVSQVISVKESGVDTDTEVLTDTKTILLTVTPS
ncbi:MAG: hypothetical protein OXP71_10405 [Candidatus Poribacteria bacterium]|nr:hypothetical protein [Candidatus Poribacteria bacterium]